MRKLYIESFSCIDSAELWLSRITVLVGPQASGKSVLSKLVFFFNSILQDQYTLTDEQPTVSDLKTHIRTKFEEWFPHTAWGPKKFCIEYTAGDFRIRLTRRVLNGKPAANVRVTLSSYFEEQFEEYAKTILTLKESQPEIESDDFGFDYMLQAREINRKKLAEHLADDYVARQLFVPAGRSFFTTVGKAMAIFESGRILDPITMIFGRYFSALKDRGFNSSPPFRGVPRAFGPNLMRKLFGGQIRRVKDTDYIETEDGRRVPFSALSSGQQELLPLWAALDQWTNPRLARLAFGRRMAYLEEPEAHLFPSAQSMVVEMLATLVLAERGGTDLLVTTHSPYVLAKLNNLLKAGELSLQLPKSRLPDLEKLIPQACWLSKKDLKAFAIQNRQLVDISDTEGLIDGDYLDSVSTDISIEFGALLSLERSHAHSK